MAVVFSSFFHARKEDFPFFLSRLDLNLRTVPFPTSFDPIACRFYTKVIFSYE